MWLWIASAALAAMPPGIDLDDLDRWETAGAPILDGPEGCWEMIGQATWNWDLARWGGSRGDALFVGRLVDGVWTGVHLEPLGEVLREGPRDRERWIYQDDEPRFAPLVGRLTGGEVSVSSEGETTRVDAEGSEAEAVNVLRSALDEIGGSAESSYATWDDERQAVVLVRVVPLGERARAPEAEVTTVFPDGGDMPTALDVTFPDTFRGGRLPRWRVSNAVVHVRGKVAGGQVFPTLETFSFDFGILGFSFSGAQTIRYKSARRCPVDAPEPAPEPRAAPEPEPELAVPVTAPAPDGAAVTD